MADADTQIDLEALHSAIASQIAEAFPSFETVEFYREDERESFPTPACLLELTEAEPAPSQDAGTGQWPALLRFEARVIMSARQPQAKLEIRKAATALATWLNKRRFIGMPTDPCEVIACERDEWAPKRDNFETWRVEWVQLAMLGVSEWKNEGVVPEVVYLGRSPDIGAAHVDDYEQVHP